MSSKHLKKPNKASRKTESADKAPKPKKAAAPGSAGKQDFKPALTEEEKALRKKKRLSRRDTVGAIITLAAAVILFVATIVIWFYQDSFHGDDLVLSSITAAVAEEEYVFDAGSGQVFASAGKGLAVANSTGFELLNESGSVAASKLLQMDAPAIAACDSYAVFYDIGGTNIAAAWFDGTIQSLTVEGDILSATVSQGGYLTITTEATGYRALVTVYNAELSPVYKWYSSSAWVISGAVSPDNRKLAVLSYTASGSEVRLFDLHATDQKAAFSVEEKVLLDLHWFSSSQLCAYTTDQVFFFNSDGRWQDTYSFADQYLTGCAMDGDGFITFSLSPYRAGTTSVLVSLEAGGKLLGTADIQSEIISMTASGSEVLVLCADGAILYDDELSEKGRITGLPGFKYGLLRNRGEALLIASNYAEVYKF